MALAARFRRAGPFAEPSARNRSVTSSVTRRLRTQETDLHAKGGWILTRACRRPTLIARCLPPPAPGPGPGATSGAGASPDKTQAVIPFRSRPSEPEGLFVSRVDRLHRHPNRPDHPARGVPPPARRRRRRLVPAGVGGEGPARPVLPRRLG